LSILPFDLGEILYEELARDLGRQSDGLMHASSHLSGSLRHAQLEVTGAPKRTDSVLSYITLKTGHLWHEYMHDTLRTLGVPYMAEVKLTPWMPKGWGGTADAIVWNPEYKAFVLADFKTQKGEGMRYIVRDGAKDDHRFQTSLYWHAVKKMGVPLLKQIGVWYLPKNDTRNKDEIIEPVLVDFDPLPQRELTQIAKTRFNRLLEYEKSLPFVPKSVQVRELGIEPEEVDVPEAEIGQWVTDALEPPQQREQRVYFDRKTETWDVKLVPHWSAAYCPFPDTLCDCSKHGETKIGMFDVDGSTYVPRKGYEDIEPVVTPQV
jgi:hypothetical protein